MLKRFYKDLKRYFRYAVKSAKASLKAEVAGSYLNWIWWILNPLSFMLIYAFIFGVVFDAREDYFSIFIFIGLSMWDFFNHTVTHSVRMVKNNKSIVSKVYLPKFVLIIADMFVNGFKMMISFGIVVLMMIVARVPLSWSFLWFFPVIIVLFIITFACALFLMHLGVLIQDMPNIVNIVLRLLFYFTGIFYDIEKRIPVPYNMWAIRINPIACLIVQMRKALLSGQVVMAGMLLIWFVVGVIASIFGVRLIYKNENGYVKVI